MDLLIDFLQRNWLFVAIIAGLLYALWRQSRKFTQFAERQEFEALVNAGFPVVVEFFDEA
jgi:hypothetical protein